MSEYTPTTEHVRAQYARQENYDDYYEGDLYLTPDGQLSAQKFDRWLAQHEAEMVARTLNAVSLYLNESLIEAVSQGRVSLIFNELTDDEWLGWVDDAYSLIKRGN